MERGWEGTVGLVCRDRPSSVIFTGAFTMASELAKKIVADILSDMTDRRGFRQEWDGVDEDIQTEIREVWEAIVDKAITTEKPE